MPIPKELLSSCFSQCDVLNAIDHNDELSKTPASKAVEVP
jgi:hypothetical protein